MDVHAKTYLDKSIRTYLDQPIRWRRGADAEYPYECIYDGESLRVKVNDFPAEHLYSLLVNDNEFASFDDWPISWVRDEDSEISDVGMFPLHHITSDGRYEIGEKLGQGGMGIVHKAFDRVLGIEVALKFQLPGADSKGKALFRREARAMAKLAGRMHIVSIFNIGTSDMETMSGPEPVPYVALEYLDGGSAQQMVGTRHQSKSLEEIKRCVAVVIQASNGLARAHDAGILHRDIKPSNLLLQSSGIVKVGDFGLAKITINDSTDRTAKGHGTQLYMAPEQFDPHHQPNARIDVWQLGATLYHLLTGRLPRETNFQKPCEINPNIPERISDYVLKMLNMDPEERPRDCDEVADLLQRELDLLDASKQPAGPIDIVHLEQFRRIRHALKDKVEQGVKDLALSRVVLPKKGEKQLWYATLLMRPYQQNVDGNKRLMDRFKLIYFAGYSGQRRVSFSDWEKDSHLITMSLSIEACSSGLPVRWYRQGSEWARDKDLFIVERESTHNVIRYFALKNVKWARFEDTETNIIKESYATDTARQEWPRAIGWDMETKEGQKRRMSQDIQTEILIPIYNLHSRGSRPVGDSDILGVANFEWEEQFSNQRIAEVGNYLATMIQDENCFDLSEFTCDVLPNVTLSNVDVEDQGDEIAGPYNSSETG